MIYKNIIVTILISIVFCYLCIKAFQAKENHIAVGAVMEIVALLGMGFLADLPEEIRLSEFYKFYILFLLVIMAVFGMIVMSFRKK